MLKRYAAAAFATLAAALLLAYCGDYAVLELRIHTSREVHGTVPVRRYYAVPQKNGKIEFLSAEPLNQECVYALFPHDGDPPCWYLARHKEQRIEM